MHFPKCNTKYDAFSYIIIYIYIYDDDDDDDAVKITSEPHDLRMLETIPAQ